MNVVLFSVSKLHLFTALLVSTWAAHAIVPNFQAAPGPEWWQDQVCAAVTTRPKSRVLWSASVMCYLGVIATHYGLLEQSPGLSNGQ